ncbi:FUSC family protein [Dactylosporangium cerinum]
MDPARPKPSSKSRALVTEPLGALLTSVPKSRPSWLTVVKTTVAATVAWVLARHLDDNAAVLFAPIVAILTLQASVYGSVATGLQLLFANLVGTALAIGWVQLLGLTWWSLALAAFAALAVARQITNTPLARNQLTIAMVAVLVLAPVAKGYGQWRFVDVAIGSVVGLLVAVIVPERPRVRQARQALDYWAATCVTVLEDIAAELDRRAGGPVLAPAERHDWIPTSRGLSELSAAAAAELAGVEETARLNVAAGSGGGSPTCATSNCSWSGSPCRCAVCRWPRTGSTTGPGSRRPWTAARSPGCCWPSPPCSRTGPTAARPTTRGCGRR